MPDKIVTPTQAQIDSVTRDPEKDLDFTVREYIGNPLQRVVDGKPGEDVPATEELVVETQYCCLGLFGYHVGVIVKDNLGIAYLDAGGVIAYLHQGEDDRNVWSISSWVNVNALKKLNVTSVE